MVFNEFSVFLNIFFLTFQSPPCPDLQKRGMQRVEQVMIKPNCYSVSLRGVDDLIFSFAVLCVLSVVQLEGGAVSQRWRLDRNLRQDARTDG